jgi:hypothetical protein
MTLQVKLTLALVAIFCLSAMGQSDQTANLRQKAESKKSETLVFKGFYLGMPIADAQTLLNNHLGLPPASAKPVPPPKPVSSPETDDQFIKQLTDELTQLGERRVKGPEGSFKIHYSDGQLHLQRDPQEWPFASATPYGIVTAFHITKAVRDKLFDAANTPTKEFLQTFVSAYGVENLEFTREELGRVVFGTKVQVGFQDFYQHRNSRGYEIKYYMEPTIIDEDRAGLVSPMEADTMTINVIKNAAEQKAKFD